MEARSRDHFVPDAKGPAGLVEDDVTKLASLVPPVGTNKYELAIIAAREARRLNEWMRRTSETVPGKVTAVALERTIHSEVPFFYDDTLPQ
jgi:DNA-directed RNA polymerase subunit K/omega